MQVDTVECSNWDDFVEALAKVPPAFVFRGQASAEWELESTLERTPSGWSREQSESMLLKEFQRRAHGYLGVHEVPQTRGEWLALMRHHAVPTRFVDFTASPYIAAFFALESVPPDGSSRCAVWAVNKDWCNAASGKLALAVEPKDELFHRTVDDLLGNLMGIDYATDRWSAAGMLIGGSIDTPDLQSPRTLGVLAYQPHRLVGRISVQQGVLLWPRDLSQTFRENLEALGGVYPVRKITLPVSERVRGLSELRRMNVTRASLFPGLDGFARSLEHLLLRETDEVFVERILEDAKARIERRLSRESGESPSPTT